MVLEVVTSRGRRNYWWWLYEWDYGL